MLRIVSLGMFLYLEIVDIREEREKKEMLICRYYVCLRYRFMKVCANRCNLININSLVTLQYKEYLSDTRDGVMT